MKFKLFLHYDNIKPPIIVSPKMCCHFLNFLFVNIGKKGVNHQMLHKNTQNEQKFGAFNLEVQYSTSVQPTIEGKAYFMNNFYNPKDISIPGGVLSTPKRLCSRNTTFFRHFCPWKKSLTFFLAQKTPPADLQKCLIVSI